MDFEDRILRTSSSPELAPDVSTTPIAPPRPARGRGSTIVPVVLSGGSGSRLWPYSTEETPKQFLSFMGAKSLFRMTIERIQDRVRYCDPIVVGSVRHAELCELELAASNAKGRLILEPCARNTAAAIAMAAAVACEEDGEETLLLILPSDHMIADLEPFHAAVDTGAQAARAGQLVTFGIRPTTPETGFGYIETGDSFPGVEGAARVRRFIEKPVSLSYRSRQDQPGLPTELLENRLVLIDDRKLDGRGEISLFSFAIVGDLIAGDPQLTCRCSETLLCLPFQDLIQLAFSRAIKR